MWYFLCHLVVVIGKLKSCSTAENMKRLSEKHLASDGPRCRVRLHRVCGKDSLEHSTSLGVAALGQWVAGEEHLVTLQHVLWDIVRVAAGMCKPCEVRDWEGPGMEKGGIEVD